MLKFVLELRTILNNYDTYYINNYNYNIIYIYMNSQQLYLGHDQGLNGYWVACTCIMRETHTNYVCMYSTVSIYKSYIRSPVGYLIPRPLHNVLAVHSAQPPHTIPMRSSLPLHLGRSFPARPSSSGHTLRIQCLGRWS